MLAAQLRNNAVPTNRASTLGYEKPGGEIPYFVVTALDWAPRSGLDLDAGIRLRTPAQQPDPRPNPHAIGALSGFFPQIDLWRFLGKKAAMEPGPIIGSPQHGMLSAPGTEGYFPAWYRNLKKAF